MENTQIVARHGVLVTQRKTVDQIWDVIRRYVMPMRSDFFKELNSEHSVEWRQNRIVFDSTAGDGLETLSSSLHGSLTSPAIQWFELGFRGHELQDDIEAKAWLEACAKDVYGALQDSNFNLEMSEGYIDLCGYGNSVMIEEEDEEDEGAIVFQSSPLQDTWFEEDSKNQVLNFYRRFNWTAAQIIDKFGADKVPEKIVERAKSSAQSETKYEVIMCIFRRNDKLENKNTGGVLAALERPYGKKYVLKEGSDTLGEEGGYYEMPAYVSRWRKAAGSQWGFGPSHLALPDVLTANQLVEMTLRSTEKVVDPAILVTERGLISDVDLGPSGLTVVRDIKNSMAPFESRARFDVSALSLNDLRAVIRRIYYVDQLEMKDSPAMTATEVQVRYELMQRLLGPTLGRLENDLLSPMIQRTFNIRFRAGKFPDMPESVKAAGAAAMEITYTGPLSRAQKIDQAASIERWAGATAQLAEVRPDVLDIPDWDAMDRELGTLLGVPTKLMKSPAKVTADRKARAEAQAQERELALKEAEGNANKATGEGQQAMQQES
ncbi:hypothetical protein VPHK225_0002 [Vibrio phage K225]|nr:hypothetical protein PODOV044v1_p0005 [Vibrio phage 23E28.1]QZI92086.1 hypothetical protein PODOV045v1_p0044 [Vibrio phage 69E27.1]